MGCMSILIVRNQADYLGTFDLKWLVYMCLFSCWLVGLSYRKIEESPRLKRGIRYFAWLLPATAVVLFLLYKPDFTVEEAIAEVGASSPGAVKNNGRSWTPAMLHLKEWGRSRLQGR